MDHKRLWKILKQMGIPDHLTCLLRNLPSGQEATVRTRHGTTDWLQIGKGPVHTNGDQSWVFIGRTDVEAETPILWPPDAKSWLIGKDPDARKDWGQEEKGMTEDEIVGWHHQLDGHGFRWILGVGDGQGGLVCSGSWGRKESDTTEWLNWTEPVFLDFPGGSNGKNICQQCGRPGFHPWVGKIPWRIATHSSILTWRIPMDRGTWRATVHGVTKSLKWLSTARHIVSHRLDLHGPGRYQFAKFKFFSQKDISYCLTILSQIAMAYVKNYNFKKNSFIGRSLTVIFLTLLWTNVLGLMTTS